MDFMTFHSVGNGKSSQLTFTPSFFRGVGQPPTSGVIPLLSHYYPIIIPLLSHYYPIIIPLLSHYYSIIIPLLFHYYPIIIPLLSHYYPIIIPLLFHYYPIIIPLLSHYYPIIIPLLFHYYPIIIPLLFHYYPIIIPLLSILNHIKTIYPGIIPALKKPPHRPHTSTQLRRGDGMSPSEVKDFVDRYMPAYIAYRLGPQVMGCHPSHWRTHIFQRGRYTTKLYFFIHKHVILYIWIWVKMEDHSWDHRCECLV